MNVCAPISAHNARYFGMASRFDALLMRGGMNYRMRAARHRLDFHDDIVYLHSSAPFYLAARRRPIFVK